MAIQHPVINVDLMSFTDLILSKAKFGMYLVFGIVKGDQDSRANLMPIYGDLYQIKL